MREPPLRIMHTSDLHLGDEMLPCNHREGFDVCVCPLLVVKAAMERWRPDALLIAGDVFDNARIGDELLARAWSLLHELPAPVVIVPGNHDALTSGNVYGRLGPSDRRVHIVREPAGELVTLLGGALSVWGKPTIEHAPWHRPLHGAPPRPPRGLYVAVAHGEFVGSASRQTVTHYASPITTEDLMATNADYVALGHWERTRCLSEVPIPVWYSGAPISARASGLLGITLGEGAAVAHVPAVIAHECVAG